MKKNPVSKHSENQNENKNYWREKNTTKRYRCESDASQVKNDNNLTTIVTHFYATTPAIVDMTQQH